jgi:mRNA interferase MazF
MHDHLRTVIVAPMSTKSHTAPFRIDSTHRGKDAYVDLEQAARSFY